MTQLFQKILNLWNKLDGYKLLIGLVIYFVIEHILPDSKDMLKDGLELIAYFFVIVGGGHKVLKSKYGQQIKARILA